LGTGGKLVFVVALALPIVSGAALGKPVNVARRVGIAETTRTFSVNPVDFNRDGRADFFFVRHNPDDLGANIPLSTLYRRGESGYWNHASATFGRTDKHDCAWGDANVDGRPDMFCAVGLTQRSENELWIQQPDRSFVDRAEQMGLTERTHGRYRYATFIHANNDVRPDIYVTRYTGSCFCDRNGDGVIDYDGDEFPNELWINEGGSFRQASEFGLNKVIGAKKDNASCAQAIDYDRDHDEDLLVCGSDELHLYRNNGGEGFTDVTSKKGLSGRAVDARILDLNGDRKRDLVRLTKRALSVRYGAGSGRFGDPQVIGGVPAGIGLGFGRFNRGPTTDVYVLAGFVKQGSRKVDQPDRVFLNRHNQGSFGAVSVPAASSGGGDDVASLDYDRDGQADFLVSNGNRKRAGPLQLWTWRR
jgi:hypothetical protein